MDYLCEYLHLKIDELYKNGNKIPSGKELDEGIKKLNLYKEDSKKRMEERMEKNNINDCKYMMNLFNKTLIKSLDITNDVVFTRIDTKKHLNYIYNLYPSNCIKYKEYKEYMDDLADRGIKLKINENFIEPQIMYELEKKILTIR